jgi:anti-sigma-K factor RskA
MNDLGRQERLLDLLTEKALYGLDEQNQKELNDLTKLFPEWQDDETLSLTAAALASSVVRSDEQLPTHLTARVLAASDRYFANQEVEHKVLDFKSKSDRSKFADRQIIAQPGKVSAKASFRNWAGWAVAAAACLALAFNVWTTRRGAATNDIAVNQPVTTTPTPALSFAEQRERLLATAPDAVQTIWSDYNPKQPRGVTGDVVWSNALQKGFLRFHNMPANDRRRETYQLWIFDAAQSAKTPIDGGVFDVDASGDVIVPINAKINVQKPTMFAVTAEKPGGVVVSEREKVMAIAKIET